MTQAIRNHFGILRFLAACGVIISHSYALSGNQANEPLVWLGAYLNLGTLSVYTFLFISGYLVTQSWLSAPSVFTFLGKRIRRIYPALLVQYGMTVFILGGLISTVPIRQYLVHPETWEYLKNIFFFADFFKFTLPGVFRTNPSPIVNGSLWTLPIEFLCYVLLALLGKLKLLRPSFIFFILLFSCWLLLSQSLYLPTTILYILKNDLLRFLPFFFVGSFFFLQRKYIRPNWWVTFLCTFLFVFSIKNVNGYFFTLLTLPYILNAFIFSATRFLDSMDFLGNYSYGMYIYAWVIQQVLLFQWPTISLPLFTYLSLFFSLLVGVLSWKLVEQPILEIEIHKLKISQLKRVYSSRLAAFFPSKHLLLRTVHKHP